VTEEQPSLSPVVMPTPETVEEGGDVNVSENGKTEEDADPNNATSDSSTVEKATTGAANSISMTENPLPKSMITTVVAVVAVVSLVVSLVVLRARHRRVEHLVKTGASTVGSSATASGEINYNDYDWEELPAPVREAAMTLGYDERMWDVGHEPQVADKSWERLTPKELEAARLLGYTQEKWDSE
jgi:multisubunit Na+/H+ antiporter MnhC subunit